MIYVLVENNQAAVLSYEEAKERKWVDVQCRHDWENMEQVEAIVELLGETFMAVNEGQNYFNIIKKPMVGDEVSYAFNGDYTPCGVISKISKTMKKITTSDGMDFYRVKDSGSWVNNGTWSLVQGHHYERNMEF